MSSLVETLEASRDDFIAAAHSVPEHLSQTKPGEGRWSVLDCVEHIVITEGRFLGWLLNPIAEPAPPENREKEAKLAERMPQRVTRVQAPEAVVPTGRFADLAEALEEFRAARGRTIQFAQEKGSAGLYTLSAKHAFFGLVNGMELMAMISAHGQRHAAQIREIREQVGQPIPPIG